MKKYDFVIAAYKSKRKKRFGLIVRSIVYFVLCWYIVLLPEQLFSDSTSTVLLDKNGHLLGARIAKDGQWRFSMADSVPKKFETCILAFEDRNFYWHAGVSVRGIARAISQNMRNQKRISGGSTLTMQLARLMYKNPPRTYYQKILEMLVATRIEWSYSKQEILLHYASHAPFGNNVVGLEAASWRYYGRPSWKLSWAESATLAVLPNAPGLIYPGRNQQQLLAKRNRLLTYLWNQKKLDRSAYELALSEPLPGKPLPLPQLAPHLMEQLIRKGKKGQTIKSSIAVNVQQTVGNLLNQYSRLMQENKVFNGAVIVTSVKTGDVLAYVGNTSVKDPEHASFVDCASAPRSSGSILKPFLYMHALDDGLITPKMLLSDVPSHFGSFSPKNFAGNYEGAIPAEQALARSLNVPMVHLLNDYGVIKFHRQLKSEGISTLRFSARHYGLSLILGGAETKLIDLASLYTRMAQKLSESRVTGVSFTEKKSPVPVLASRGAIYQTFEALLEVNRPDEDNNWRIFSSSRKIAWKTGTSFGFRDAWAIGVTPDYVVAVWIGNADGEGRPGLTGTKAAAPLMFDIFRQLPKGRKWFGMPGKALKSELICKKSGYLAGKYCESEDVVMLPEKHGTIAVCPYHEQVNLSMDGNYRVNTSCESSFHMLHKKWFVLPSLQEHYYKMNHPDYKTLPPFRSDCMPESNGSAFVVVYPKPNSRIHIPVELDGTRGRSIFEVAHRNDKSHVFWHLDNQFIGETVELHQLPVNPGKGKHVLKVVDENGESKTIRFEVY